MAIVNYITVIEYALILVHMQWWLLASAKAGVHLPEQLTAPILVEGDLHWWLLAPAEVRWICLCS